MYQGKGARCQGRAIAPHNTPHTQLTLILTLNHTSVLTSSQCLVFIINYVI